MRDLRRRFQSSRSGGFQLPRLVTGGYSIPLRCIGSRWLELALTWQWDIPMAFRRKCHGNWRASRLPEWNVHQRHFPLSREHGHWMNIDEYRTSIYLSYPILSCPILSYPILSYLSIYLFYLSILSYLILSYLILSIYLSHSFLLIFCWLHPNLVRC